MKQIKNGYDDRYYMTEQGAVYDAVNDRTINADKQYMFTLKLADNGKYHRISQKNLYYLIFNAVYCKDDIQSLDGEEWRTIAQTNGQYQVSNYGRIKSLCGYKARLINWTITEKGYAKVIISYDKGISQGKFIHRLVASAFLEAPIIDDYQIHHIDGNRLNNHADNLECLSRIDHIKRHKEMKERAQNECAESKDNNH